MMAEQTENIAGQFMDDRTVPDDIDFKGLQEAVFNQFNIRLAPFGEDTLGGLTPAGLSQLILDNAQKAYDAKQDLIGSETMRELECAVMLQNMDNLWKDHLLSMDHLKEGIGLRGYAQQDPLLMYKKEGFDLFQDMIDRIKIETLNILFRIQIAQSEELEELRKPEEQQLTFSGGGDDSVKRKPAKRLNQKVGRNSPCPCGSGKKYKKCCGR